MTNILGYLGKSVCREFILDNFLLCYAYLFSLLLQTIVYSLNETSCLLPFHIANCCVLTTKVNRVDN